VSCERCPRGTVSSESGTECVRWPEGLMPNIPVFDEEEEANGCVLPTKGCPPGYVRQDVGSTNGPIFGCRRIACRVGTPEEDIGRTCIPCDPGEALNEVGTGCRRCRRDQFSLGGIITECSTWPNGMQRNFDDPSSSSCLDIGFGMQDGICRRCPRGSSSTRETEFCSLCPPGRFASRPGLDSCSRCPPRTFADRPGSQMCRSCPEGSIANRSAGATACIPL